MKWQVPLQDFFSPPLPIIIPYSPFIDCETCDTADQSSVYKLGTDQALGWLQSKGVFFYYNTSLLKIQKKINHNLNNKFNLK
jgi:hypothetical protein